MSRWRWGLLLVGECSADYAVNGADAETFRGTRRNPRNPHGVILPLLRIPCAQCRPSLRTCDRAIGRADRERLVDLLDLDAAVLHRLDGVGQLYQLARGAIGIGVGTIRRRISCCGLICFVPPRNRRAPRIA